MLLKTSNLNFTPEKSVSTVSLKLAKIRGPSRTLNNFARLIRHESFGVWNPRKSPGYLSVFVAHRTISDLLFIFRAPLQISQSRWKPCFFSAAPGLASARLSSLLHYSLPESLVLPCLTLVFLLPI